MGVGRRGRKWGGTMGTNGSQAAARAAAFNLIVLRDNCDRDQWYSTVILRVSRATRRDANRQYPVKRIDSRSPPFFLLRCVPRGSR